MENGSRKPELPRGLYAICDGGVRPELPLAEKARSLLDGGARVLQLRMKITADRPALAIATEVARLCRAARAVLLVNDRVDIALLSGADGVHLGGDDIPPRDARRLLGPNALIGVTARGEEDVRAACDAGADYAGVGPLFLSVTKRSSAKALGLARLEAIAGSSPLPVVAISGITLSNIEAVAKAGAHGAAVLSDLMLAWSIAEQARKLDAAFARGACESSLGSSRPR